MSILNDIEKVTDHSFIFSLITLLILIIPGSTFIFLTNKELFVATDLFKLLLLSIGVSTPLIISNVLLMILKDTPEEFKSEGRLFALFITASFLAALVIYMTVLCAYFFTLPFSESFKLMIILQTLLFIIQILPKKNPHSLL